VEHDASTTYDAADIARRNDAFRRVVSTGPYIQLVVMTIPPDEAIGEEVHPDTDQVLQFVEGQGRAVLDGEVTDVGPGDVTFVRAGTRHDFVNTGHVPLRLVTVYAPPEHPPGTVHETKAEAEAAEHDH
jgi:mannose-6-phosphate isomerase-like protein (cupin superfamily)